jgi:hypothetical protein
MAKIQLRDKIELDNSYYYDSLCAMGYFQEAAHATKNGNIKEVYTRIKGMLDDQVRSKRLYEQQRDQIGHPPMAREPLDNYVGARML